MPTMRCPKCGQLVSFQGVAGVCPKCATVVRAAKEPETPKTPAKPAPISSKQRVRLTDLHEISGQEPDVFDPTEAQVPTGKMDPGVRITLIGTGITVGLFLLYILITSFTSKSSTAPTPAPVATAVRHAPQPEVSEPQQSLVTAPPKAVETVPPIAATQPAPASRPSWYGLTPRKPELQNTSVTDEQIGAAIQRGADYVASRCDGAVLKDTSIGPERMEGAYALATYALLHSGLALSDNRFATSAPLMRDMLNQLQKFKAEGNTATYVRSLRASAFALGGRAADQTYLTRDLTWLLKAATAGRYGYDLPDKTAKPDDIAWDNSNCQYGVLGVWAAADAGQSVPEAYWEAVERHWVKNQLATGGWGYDAIQNNTTLAMTCAGLTTLSVAVEQLPKLRASDRKDPRADVTAAIDKSLAWLDQDENSVNLSNNPSYSLYGLERAALATGFKWFGKHDWYRELSATAIKTQDTEGWWNDNFSRVIDTSFHLLFLSRGRQPIFMNKLRFAGSWNNRPRDLSKLAAFTTGRLEQPFSFGVVDLSRNSWEWLDSPVLFISSDIPPNFTDDEFAKLRDYTNSGGLIFLHNETASPAMNDFAQTLASKCFPEFKLQTLAEDDVVNSALVKLPPNVGFKAVSNGTRYLMIYSPNDLTKGWITRSPRDEKSLSSLAGINVFLYAAGKDGFRKRLDTSYISPPTFIPVGTLPVIRVQYPGNWNPEPGAWDRFPRWFQNQTSIAMKAKPVAIESISSADAPVAFLTGTQALDFGKLDLDSLHQFVAKGGTLLIDSTAGNKTFAKAVRESLLPKAFPEAQPTPLDPAHPIFSAKGICMDPLPKPLLRRDASERLDHALPALDIMNVGKGTVIISDGDITAALLDTGTRGIIGYTPAYAQSLVKNVVLWTLSKDRN